MDTKKPYKPLKPWWEQAKERRIGGIKKGQKHPHHLNGPTHTIIRAYNANPEAFMQMTADVIAAKYGCSRETVRWIKKTGRIDYKKGAPGPKKGEASESFVKAKKNRKRRGKWD